MQPPVENTEAYANEAPNPVKVTAEEPVSTFSIDVDTASYAVVRSSLTGGYLPTPDQVRIEEMVNYFPYAYAAPEGEAAFASTVSVMPTPWNPGTRLVTIGIQGALPEVTARPPLNLVFLIDTSGSMEDANKLPLLKQSLSLMLAELRPEDQVSIVTYAGSAGLVLPPVQAADRAAIMAALDNLAAGGSTAGAEGLELAYQVAEEMKAEGEVTRILLATDGDFNVGIDDPEGLEAYVAKKRKTGTYLSVLGFGRGNLDDAIMQALAQNGNGTAAYIDTLSEARKVLVDQLTGALFPIADDVKIQVEWNPATVAEYRLIGYETRSLRREDFNNDAVDAGEIGAGTQVTAIYEVTAPGSDALLNDPLRYGAAPTEGTAGELGFLRLRWKAPGEAASTLVETPITGTEAASQEARFAAAVAGFGQLLQGSVYLGDWGWDQAIELALANRGEDAFGYRIEAVTLMRLAQSLNR
jgi:Ca-activated chloride channel family protein